MFQSASAEWLPTNWPSKIKTNQTNNPNKNQSRSCVKQNLWSHFHKDYVYADFEDVRPGCGSGVESLPTCVRPGFHPQQWGRSPFSVSPGVVRAAERSMSQESKVSHHLSPHLFPQNVFQFIKTNSSSVGTQSNASKS